MMKVMCALTVIALIACLIPQFWPAAPVIYGTLIFLLFVLLYADAKSELVDGLTLEQQKYNLAKKRRDMELEARKIILENERYRELFDQIQASKERIDSAEAFLRKVQDVAKNQAAIEEFKRRMKSGSASNQTETTLFDDDDDTEVYDEDICDETDVTDEEDNKGEKSNSSTQQ